jgi:glycosyltransferase involved in cell wall biosynthesis
VKVLHIAKYDLKGGAAIAAHNSVLAQRAIGIDARMAVGRKLGHDEFVAGPTGLGEGLSLARFVAEQLPSRLIGADRSDSRSLGMFGRSPAALLGDFRPDVVMLHNIDGVLSLDGIRRMPVPVVWRLHDMWAVSGHAHSLAGYPEPRRFRRFAGWLDRRLMRSKDELLASRVIQFCPPSHWLADEVRQRFGAAARVEVIPNSVDTDAFRPVDKANARRELGVVHDGPLLLFSAASGMKDHRKGADLLIAALRSRRDDLLAQGTHLLVVGGELPAEFADVLPATSLGRIIDRKKLALAYAAADLTVAPSRVENLSMVVLGITRKRNAGRSVCHRGMPDMIEDGVNGKLVDPFDRRCARRLPRQTRAVGDHARGRSQQRDRSLRSGYRGPQHAGNVRTTAREQRSVLLAVDARLHSQARWLRCRRARPLRNSDRRRGPVLCWLASATSNASGVQKLIEDHSVADSHAELRPIMPSMATNCAFPRSPAQIRRA